MTDRHLLYQIGITLVKGIGNITARQIIDVLGDVSLLFKEKASVLERIPGVSRKVIAEIRRPDVLQRAEEEMSFLHKNKIIPLYIKDEAYPQRLKDCVDAPILLFYRGNASLNAGKIISFVGTRNATPYGKEITDKLIHDIAHVYPDTLIVSGLAYGIDIHSHKASLREGLPTVGVLAHGLDRIYPPVHRNTAAEMLANGGLLTDFLSGTNPDRQNFVKRNRIVAGVADCTVVVESATKGGALITARIADSYHRDVFAIPGKATDVYSDGCNALIKSRQAALITSAEDIFREMCWEKEHKAPVAVQRDCLIDLNKEEQAVVTLLGRNENMQLNILCIQLNLPISRLAPLLFDLEMKGIVQCLPGGLYRLV
ncbi:MAG: DNA-processing protein DprA [Dysgonamonadaceae bacterium]|jgi:DNA processing protein|nr:DNA-processing protein DprA [Dysgonamonadaceae bacterium]